jgi:hypothetical protein
MADTASTTDTNTNNVNIVSGEGIPADTVSEQQQDEVNQPQVHATTTTTTTNLNVPTKKTAFKPARITKGMQDAVTTAGFPLVPDLVTYLTPTTPLPTALAAVRLQEKWGEVESIFAHERGYVRRALLRARAAVVIKCPGTTPLLLLYEVERDPVETHYTTRVVYVDACPTEGKQDIVLDIPTPTILRVSMPTQAINTACIRNVVPIRSTPHIVTFNVEEGMALPKEAIAIDQKKIIETPAERIVAIKFSHEEPQTRILQAATVLTASGHEVHYANATLYVYHNSIIDEATTSAIRNELHNFKLYDTCLAKAQYKAKTWDEASAKTKLVLLKCHHATSLCTTTLNFIAKALEAEVLRADALSALLRINVQMKHVIGSQINGGQFVIEALPPPNPGDPV